MIISFMLAAMTLFSGCKDEKRSAARSAAVAAQRVQKAAEQAIRSGVAMSAQMQMQFRGVQVYPQAMPQRTAVCGQVNPFLDDPSIFVPFVSLVTTQASQDDRAPRYQFEQHVATSTSEASRVYLAIVAYCYDNGGPVPGPYHSVMSMPPLPDTISNPSSRRKPPERSGTSPPAGSQPPASAPRPQAPRSAESMTSSSGPALPRASASGSVYMRRNGNLHSRPHGPAIRVVPQGTVMRSFSQAPGGWIQVGDTNPQGWVHESLLERR